MAKTKTEQKQQEAKPRRINCKTESELAQKHEFVRGSMIRVTKRSGKLSAHHVPDKEKLTEQDLKVHKLNKADEQYLQAKLGEGQTKHYVQRVCEETGKPFLVATSDLHQTKVCEEVRDQRRKERAKQSRKELANSKKQLEARVKELEAQAKSA